ncbi:MAG: DUF2828 family protein [Oscillospiraceae bacterium]|nr:DUF2828 family protein [Oscillospiraceae bacterium]
MLELLRAEANMTRTENGAAAYLSTGSECLDLFATIGGLRNADEDEVTARFLRAYAENADTAMKLLFYARDIRGGLGERRVFRTIIKALAYSAPVSVRKNICCFGEFGRYDDLLVLLDTPLSGDAVSYIRTLLSEDTEYMEQGGDVTLLAKWLPSVNASDRNTVRLAKKLASALGMTQETYRKTLSALRRYIHITENDLRERNYTFDYEHMPSRALYKYRKAFIRNDGERYSRFLDAAAEGKAVLNADNVAPYEIAEPFLGCFRTANGWKYMKEMSPAEEKALNASWNALPDFCGNDNSLAVIDTSGSMYYNGKPLPGAVALSLGLYFAEHNRGAFANSFIEFSATPQLITLKGRTFAEKLRYAASFTQVANTDLEAVFELILRAAVRNNVKQRDLPARLVIISDMEFDSCMTNSDSTVFGNARQRYLMYGYKLPEVVFWNVASRNRQQPVRMNEQGAALVSGVTPRLFSMIAGGELTPLKLMNKVVNDIRYACISA